MTSPHLMTSPHPKTSPHSIASPRTCLAIVLAAGEGKRMNSGLPKVLHSVAGRPMLTHVLNSLGQSGIQDVAVVVGPGRQDVADCARASVSSVQVFEQTERLGTAHAVLAARQALSKDQTLSKEYDDLLVVFADTPLIKPESFTLMRQSLAAGADVVVLGFEAANPTGYGRLIVDKDDLTAIVEHKDATEAERQIHLCNAGLMALDGRKALSILDAIGNHNAQGEFYLTDAVKIARARNGLARYVTVPESEVMGVNDRIQLAAAEAVLQHRLREAAMRAGVTLQAPETVYLSIDTQFGRDIILEPHVIIGPGVRIADHVLIRSFSHIEGAEIGTGAIIGPFARLRPGAKLANDVHIGNFVEIKASDVAAGAKINHLSYIGDASIGAKTNIGAGTITCNYDGFNKYRTTIGAGAFIGSNSALVAPVTIGDGAYIGSGSVVTENVEPDALALARGRQAQKLGWAKSFRDARRKDRP